MIGNNGNPLRVELTALVLLLDMARSVIYRKRRGGLMREGEREAGGWSLFYARAWEQKRADEREAVSDEAVVVVKGKRVSEYVESDNDSDSDSDSDDDKELKLEVAIDDDDDDDGDDDDEERAMIQK
jgi:hypothetical protein